MGAVVPFTAAGVATTARGASIAGLAPPIHGTEGCSRSSPPETFKSYDDLSGAPIRNRHVACRLAVVAESSELGASHLRTTKPTGRRTLCLSALIPIGKTLGRVGRGCAKKGLRLLIEILSGIESWRRTPMG
jgi:hypothetical protein